MTYFFAIVTLLIFLFLPAIFFFWILHNNRLISNLNEKIVKILNRIGEKW